MARDNGSALNDMDLKHTVANRRLSSADHHTLTLEPHD